MHKFKDLISSVAPKQAMPIPIPVPPANPAPSAAPIPILSPAPQKNVKEVPEDVLRKVLE